MRKTLISLIAIVLFLLAASPIHATPLHQQPPGDQGIIIMENGQYYAFTGGPERLLISNDRDYHVRATDCAWSPQGDWVQVDGFDNTNKLTRLSDGYSLTITAYYEQDELGNFPAWSPDGEFMVYEEHSPTGQDTDLYRMDTNGTQPYVLISLPDSEFLPQFNSTGDWIYFASDALDYDTLYRVRPDGSELTEILRVEGTFRRVVLAPNDEWIYYSVNTGVAPQSAIHTYHLTDGQDYFLDDSPHGTRFDGISPDSQWVLYNLIYPNPGGEPAHRWELYAVRMDNSQRQYVVDFSTDGTLFFSPDSQYVFVQTQRSFDFTRARLGSNEPPTLIFNRGEPSVALVNDMGFWYKGEQPNSAGNYAFAIYFAPLDGSEIRMFPIGSAQVRLSPDQKWFAGVDEGKLYRVRTDGTAFDPIAVPLETNLNIRQSLVWSPDGQWIAMNGNEGLFVMPADGLQFELLLGGYASMPWAWANDSGRIYAQNAEAFYAVPPDGSSPEVIVEGSAYSMELSPDNRWVSKNNGNQMINLNTGETWNIPEAFQNAAVNAASGALSQHKAGEPHADSYWSLGSDARWSVDSRAFIIYFWLQEEYTLHSTGLIPTQQFATTPLFYYQISPDEHLVSDLIAGSPPNEGIIVQCTRL